MISKKKRRNRRRSRAGNPNANQTIETNSNLTVSPEETNKTVTNSLPRKKFAEMSEPEKDEYVKIKAEKIARIIGNQTSEPIPPEAVRSIRGHLKGYLDRVRAARVNNCSQGVFMRSRYDDRDGTREPKTRRLSCALFTPKGSTRKSVCTWR